MGRQKKIGQIATKAIRLRPWTYGRLKKYTHCSQSSDDALTRILVTHSTLGTLPSLFEAILKDEKLSEPLSTHVRERFKSFTDTSLPEIHCDGCGSEVIDRDFVEALMAELVRCYSCDVKKTDAGWEYTEKTTW